ncbi:MAG: hypothetical protein NTV29_10095 [Planctomycetota bacterium]|nr:hypothetical protein [Planctomycetota bacterium]
MQLHQRPDLKVLGYCAASMPLSLCYLPWRSSARTRRRAACITAVCRPCPFALAYIVAVAGVARLQLLACSVAVAGVARLQLLARSVAVARVARLQLLAA